MTYSVDLFAGGGGASLAIQLATGRSPAVAVNHDPAAIAMHADNHPETRHLCESVLDVKPRDVVGRRRVDLLWASPDCTHHSRAKGGKPRSNKLRGLAWVVHDWAAQVRPRVICLENVPEFITWGPLDKDGRPDPLRSGETFAQWKGWLETLGYVVEHRVLNAADYGAPTSRRRLFVVARCDGEPVVWPEPTHGPGRARPYRTAAECIDWSIPVPSIFDRSRPLAAATCRRIAAGIHRYVMAHPDPFIVSEMAPCLVQTGYGERAGQRPRALDLQAPLGTVVATGQKHALVSAWIAKHYGGVTGIDARQPMGTVTAKDHHAAVATAMERHPARQERARDVAAFLTTYYGQGVGQDVRVPLRTVVSRDRFGVVTAEFQGEPWTLTDIGMRMLQPRELARAQGFPDSYILTGTKTEQVKRIGNSVPPAVARALIEANIGQLAEAA